MSARNILIETLHAGEKSEIRVSLTPDGQKVDVRRFDALTTGSNLYTSTGAGLSLPLADIPAVIRALQTASARAQNAGGVE